MGSANPSAMHFRLRFQAKWTWSVVLHLPFTVSSDHLSKAKHPTKDVPCGFLRIQGKGDVESHPSFIAAASFWSGKG